jgi:creatinine amidohydrolase
MVADLPKNIVVVVPVASLEQHSLHLPLFTDTRLLEEAVRRVEPGLRWEMLALPVMWLGYSHHHIKYPGTVTAGSSTHLDLMNDIVSSMLGHGFRRILLLNSHGGNQANLSVLLQRLMEQEPEAEVFAATLYSPPSTEKAFKRILEAGDKGSGHAGETETSMMMAIEPDLVHGEEMFADGDEAQPLLKGVTNYRRMDQRTRHGGVGDPRSATAEKGEKLFKAIVDGLERTIKTIHAGKALP